MKITEIFYSLSGEGIHAGIPTVFIRLAGCNLRCTYCDTQYAWEDGEEMTIQQIKEHPQLNPVASLLITGGEPLLHPDDVYEILANFGYPRNSGKGRLIEIETNGSFDPPTWFNLADCWSVDVKCPSSGSSYGTFRRRWLSRLRKQDQLKFVVGTEEDLDFVKGFLNGNRCRAQILMSPAILTLPDSPSSYPESSLPMSGRVWWLQRVAEFCKEQNLRMSLQMHKIIYGNQRGV